MNYAKIIQKLEKRVEKTGRELEKLQAMQARGETISPERMMRLTNWHRETMEKLDDLERIVKNRMFQHYGLDYYLKFEEELEKEQHGI